MRAIWIDAERGEVTEIVLPDREEGRLEAMQRAVGGCIEAALDLPASPRHAESLYVDEEGLLKEYAYGFSWAGALQPYFAGSGLVSSYDPSTGETRATRMAVEEVRARVTFVRWLYLATVMALAFRGIVGWAMAAQIDLMLAGDALQRRRPSAPLRLRQSVRERGLILPRFGG
ncbi:MAG: DUF3846 domain-containing protein [Armatimonadota bacterium]